jgi:hypothetical protein
VNPDAKPNELFTPGPTLDDPPTGDIEREAVASLRGYAYQVVVATLAWLDLDDHGRLYLEVAEDYAMVAEQSLNAVQVKDTAGSGTITLNTQAVKDAIAAFIELVKNNKGRNVHLRYFTTSPIGAELKVSERPGGEPGLKYWRKAAAGASVGPLRAKLTGGNFGTDVADFVRERTDEELRQDLLQKIHWDADQEDLAGVTRELEERLVVLGRDKFGLAAQEARRLKDLLIYHVLESSIIKDRAKRVLTRAELYTAFDAATQVVVPRQAANAMAQLGPMLAAALTGGQGGGSFAPADISWITRGDELPTPRGVISRPHLVSTIETVMARYGQAILVGASGLGKSLAAREVARKRSGGFASIDLRGFEPSEATGRLNQTLGRIGTIDFECLIFDDFNAMEDAAARVSFARCGQALWRRDRTAIVTTYRRPSQRALTELGLPGEAVIEVPYLTAAEADEIVRVANGDAEKWGKIAYAVGAQGHPQLTHAFAMGMAARGWPKAEMHDVIIRGFASDDTDAERDAARRALRAVLSDDARTLLYRLSLVFGRFDRNLAIVMGQLSPPTAKSGELLDELIGPWIETVGTNAFRVSPLALNAGHGMLNASEQTDIHEAVAVQKLANRRIDASDANSILTHALLGKSGPSLLVLAFAVLTAEEKVTEALQEQFFVLRILRTDHPIFEDNPVISVMLRLAQLKLLASKGDGEGISDCVQALLREAGEIKDASLGPLTDVMALSSVLNIASIASWVLNWIDLLQRLKEGVEANSMFQEYKKNMEKAATEEGMTCYGATFSIGSHALKTVQRLEEVLLDLDGLSPADRSVWLESFDRKPSDYGVLVNAPWTEEHRRKQLNAADAVERYRRMSSVALEWGKQPLALQCITASVVMLDEYMDDENAAHEAINQAIRAVGENELLLRARAKLFWRHRKYSEAVDVFRTIAEIVALDSPVDRAFALREAAMSAANIGEWQLAAKWFGDAKRAADQAHTDDMHVMSMGLRADATVACLRYGNVKAALEGMVQCLSDLQSIDPDSSLKARYCHHVIRHAVLWMDTQIDGRETLIDRVPVEMLSGACSNPEPPAAIVERPLGSLDLAWYMLAEAEISSGIDVGVDRTLPSKLQGGPILFMEVDKRNRRITRDVITSDANHFAMDLGPYLAGVEYFRLHGKSLRETSNAIVPAHGQVPALSAAQLMDPNVVGVAVDAVLAFGLAAALKARAEPMGHLQASLSGTFGPEFPGKAVVDKWLGTDTQLAPLDQTIVQQVTQLRSQMHLTPRQGWELALRAFEKIRQSLFRKALLPMLGTWLRGQWRRIIETERFRLSRPMLTVPTIETILKNEANDEAFIASLLLAGADAVGSPLASAYEQQLRSIAKREAQDTARASGG